MDISMYEIEDLILAAMKSEVDSKKIYNDLAGQVKNFMLKDRLEFLAQEEEKHRGFFEELYKDRFGGKEIVLPDKSPVPLPEVEMKEGMPPSKVLEQAMEAEEAAREFYTDMAERFPDDEDHELRMRLEYIAAMEQGHYRILEIEKIKAEEFEERDAVWPAIHLGP